MTDDESEGDGDTADSSPSDDSSGLVATVRSSRELRELREAAGVSETLEHTGTERGDPTVVTLHHREEFDGGPEDFVPYREITVEGYFSRNELRKVVLAREELMGPLLGEGVEFIHEDGEISTRLMWVS